MVFVLSLLALGSPTDFEATVVTTSSVTLTWQHPDSDILVFSIQYSVAGSDDPLSEEVFEEGATSGLIENLLPGQTYTFILTAQLGSDVNGSAAFLNVTTSEHLWFLAILM